MHETLVMLINPTWWYYYNPFALLEAVTETRSYKLNYVYSACGMFIHLHM